MKPKIYFAAIFCILAAVSCSKKADPDPGSGDPIEMTFSATVESVTNGPAIAWLTGDQISVYDGKSNNRFTTTGSGQTASFTGNAIENANEYLSLYPYMSGATLSTGKVSVEIPATQQAVAGGFALAAHHAVAYAKGGTSLNFKNVAAFLKITLDAADGVESVQISANNDEKIAGAIEVGISDNITVVPATGASSSISLTGGSLAGSYYILASPQTLSGGYTITLADANDMMYTVKVTTSTTFTRNQVFDLGTYSDIQDWVPAVNPNPSALSISLLKASFTEAEFNAISEPGFETYPSMGLAYRTSWIPNQYATTGTGHTGNVAVMMTNDTGFVWWEIRQSVALRPQTDYQYSVWAKANTNDVYNGVRLHPDGGAKEIAGSTWKSEEWTPLSIDFNSGACYYTDVFAGIWGGTGSYIAVDDFKIVPKGYDEPSMDPSETTELGHVGNATFNDISSLDKAVIWKGLDGSLRIALSGVTIKEQTYDTAFALSAASDLSGAVNIDRIVKEDGAIVPIYTPDSGTIVPNSAFTHNNKTYLHYYIRTTATDQYSWTASKAGFLVSEDDGLTWTAASGAWAGDKCFASAGFCFKDGNIYMVGSKTGRSKDTDYWKNMYVARADASADFTDPAIWDYWNGTAWVSGDENACNSYSCCITVGSSGEPALVYNDKFERFMMIYRSAVHGGLVYRDADAVDGFWSGEKIITNDDATGLNYAPSVLEVTSEGDLLMAAPQL